MDLLDSLRAITYPAYEVLLVDNGALPDEFPDYEAHLPEVRVIRSSENLGFAGGNNLAIQEARGQYILLLNNDTVVPPNFLEPLVELMETKPDSGIVSPKIYYHEDPRRLQYAGQGQLNFVTGRGQDAAKGQLDEGQFETVRTTDFTHGACMLIRREVLEQIGLLTEDYFLYYEELDFCLRTRATGWQLYYTPQSYIHHRESVSVGKASPLKTHYMFRNRWLLVRRFGTASTYWLFFLYYVGIGVPKHLFRHMLRGEWTHVKALVRGLAWNFRHGRQAPVIPSFTSVHQPSTSTTS